MPSPDRVRLVVLFGGRSAEHDVSRVSASHVLRAVDPNRYDVVPVGISRSGDWRVATEAAELVASGQADALPTAIEIEGEASTASLVLGPGTPKTVVFPILHGPNGEDGTIQGLLEALSVPYVGSGVLGSAVAMDKAMAKTVLSAHGIPQPRWRSLESASFVEIESTPQGSKKFAQDLLDELGPTVFVKPANMGSSIGVSRAAGIDHLIAALQLAFQYDDFAVIEEAVAGRELEVGVLGNSRPRASVVGEVVPAAEFYDFEDKYSDGAARTVIPANIAPELGEQLREVAVQTFKALRAEGMARVDVFLEEGDENKPGRGILVNEINTIPGFTPISMFPMLWEATGLSYRALIDELVQHALERHDRRSRLRTDVQTREAVTYP